jgi:uncharacterized protein (DUF1800 family)
MGGKLVADELPPLSLTGTDTYKEYLTLALWWLNAMIVTKNPLREKLVLFWHGHVTSGISKVGSVHLMFLQNELFRRLGALSFGDLAHAVAKSGSMMSWLDVPTSTSVKAHRNENFARELLELFTPGIGNYSQSDVVAASRAFTGWYHWCRQMSGESPQGNMSPR